MPFHRSSSHGLIPLAVALLAFAPVMLPRSFMPIGVGAAYVLAMCQAAVAAGCLVAAYLWRRDSTRSPRVEGHASAAGATAALLAAMLLAAPLMGEGVNAGLAMLSLLALSTCVGATIGAVLSRHPHRCGLMTAAYLIGVLGGSTLPAGSSTQAFAAGGAAAGAALLAISYRRPVPLVLSGLGFALALGIFLASSAGELAEQQPLLEQWWQTSPMAGGVPLTTVWVMAVVVIAVSGGMVARVPRGEQQDQARLSLMAMLWGSGAAMLVWQAMLPLRPTAVGDLPLAELVLGAGAVVGVASVDAWPTGSPGLRRAAVLGSIGIGGAVLTGLLLAPSADPELGPTVFVLALLGATGLTISLMVPSVSKAGAVYGPAQSAWLWACGMAAVVATWIVLDMTGLMQPVGRGLAAVGVACAVLSVLARYEVALSSDLPRWLRAEWGKAPLEGLQLPDNVYCRGWMLTVKNVTYSGYFPWWVAGCLVRLGGLVAVTVLTTLGEIAADTLGSLAKLIFARTPETAAERVEIPDRSPLVELSAARDWGGSGGARRVVEQTRWSASVVDVLTLPILALAFLIDAAVQLSQAAVRRVGACWEQKAPSPVTSQDLAETIPLGPPPDVVPGPVVDPDERLRQSLSRLTQDPVWRRALRAMLGWILGAAGGGWLSADVAEPWDDRIFQAEVIGSRGRRFELAGRVWRSPRRRGCVVTIPQLSGSVDKAVEVSARHREIRELVSGDSVELRNVLLRAGFRMAIRDLVVGAAGKRNVAFKAPREDLLEPNQDRQCDLRLEAPGGGHQCREPMPQDRTQGRTSPTACESCRFPEIWARCRNLKLEGTIAQFDHEGRLRRQALMACRLTGKAVDAEKCLRQECFSPSTITRIVEVQPGRTR